METNKNHRVDRVAAIPFLAGAAPSRIVVVTRRSGEWILPRGRTRDGTPPHLMAGIEAFEEAGAIGRVSATAVGQYTIRRRGRILAVNAYPMLVDHLLSDWPEWAVRERQQVGIEKLNVFPLSECHRGLIERARDECLWNADSFEPVFETPHKLLRRWRVTWSAAG